MNEWQEQSLERVQDVLDQFYKMKIVCFGEAIAKLYVVIEYIRKDYRADGDAMLKHLEKIVGFKRRKQD